MAAPPQSVPVIDGAAPLAARFDDEVVIRVTLRTAQDHRLIEQLSDDCWSSCFAGARPDGTADYRLARSQLAALDHAGIPYQVLIPSVQALIDRERTESAAPFAPRAWFDQYQDYAALGTYLDTLRALRPDLARRITLGASLQGRDIFGLRITAPTGAVGGSKPKLFVHGLQHAREWITGMTVMYLADYLVRQYGIDPRATAVLNRYEVIIVPCLNPDGYVFTWTNNRLWRKNRSNNSNGTRGVDLNRNWGTGWGGEGASNNPSSDTYRGPTAFSEPETRAARDFMLNTPGVLVHWDVHSYSQLILSPFGYTAALPVNAAVYQRLNAAIEAGMQAPYGLDYTAGPTYTTIYPASGVSSDWSHSVIGALGWGLELRDTGQNGFILPANQIIPNAQELLGGFFGLTAKLCPADFNGDAFVDDADFAIFADAYDRFADRAGDLNGDDFTDDADFVWFAAAYDQFACP